MTSIAYKVNKAEALRYLGHSGQDLTPDLDARIDAQIAACERESAPAFVYRLFPVVPTDQGVRLEGTAVVLEGESIAAHLAGAVECAVMACSLGLVNEMGLRKRSLTNSLDAAIFSSAGSSLVECVANACEAAIVAEAIERGLHANWRFSPGYGDLSLACQPAIIASVGADKALGISLSESGLMTPSKSITALVGLFESAEAHAEAKRSCAGCACYDYCSLRRAGSPCWKR